MSSILRKLKIPGNVSTVSKASFNSLIDYFINGVSGMFFTSPVRYSASNNITAHPSGEQRYATRLISEINNITTVTENGDSVKLLSALVGYYITVTNSGSNNLSVYPYELDSIDDGVADTPITMLPNETIIFRSVSDNKWVTTKIGGVTIPNPSSVYDLQTATPFTLLTNGTITISNPKLMLPTGDSGQNTLVPTSGITYISGSNMGLSSGATSNANALYNDLVLLSGFTFGAVNLETVNAGYGTGRFVPGVYRGTTSIVTSASQTITLIGDGDYVFISNGATTFGATTTILLTHGAQASRVFWVSVGAITTGAVNVLKGNFMTTAAINVGATNDIEGRLLSTLSSAITIDGTSTNIYLP